MVTRHEFLAELHNVLNPFVYLEVGVQHGHSLALAKKVAIGIDPNPLITPRREHEYIEKTTSREFFSREWQWNRYIDLAFIDGSHLVEDAIADFEGVLERSHERTVIVFDDVLPYTQEMTSRTMIDGDWTGDVWKVTDWIHWNYPLMGTAVVDTFPTGLLVCWGVHTPRVANDHRVMLEDGVWVPQDIIDRGNAHQPVEAMDEIVSWWHGRFPVPPEIPVAN